MAAKKKKGKKTANKVVKNTTDKKIAPAKVKKRSAREGKKVVTATAASVLGIANPKKSSKATPSRPTSIRRSTNFTGVEGFIKNQHHLSVKIIDISELDFVNFREDYLKVLEEINR